MAETIKIDVSGFRKVLRKFGALSPATQAMYKQWGVRYLAFTRREFVKASKGSGGWKALAPATVKARRGGKRRKTRSRRARAKTTTRGSAGRVRILRDTGILFNALTIGAAGNLHETIRNGVRVGFGGPARHPGGKATIADIAEFHNTGAGDLPKREILKFPDRRTSDGMSSDMKRTVARILRAASI